MAGGMVGGDAAQWAKYQAEQAKKSPQTAGGLSPESGRTYAANGSYTDYGVGLENQLATREKYNAMAQDRLLGKLGGALGPMGDGAAAPPVSRTTGDIAAREQAGRAAAFARAKEQSGQIAQSSLAGLRNSLSRRGITGGGYAQMRGAEALAPATDRLQDFTREQAIQDVNNLQHTGDLEYQGGITQRGQDLQNRQSLLSLLRSGGALY